MSIIINGQNLSKAIERCKSQHPRVAKIAEMQYAVSRSAGGSATVRFFRDAQNNKCAACDCPAGQRPTALVCYHIAAAIELHCALVRQRAARTPAASIAADAGADFCEDFDHTEEERTRAIATIARQLAPAIARRRAADEAIYIKPEYPRSQREFCGAIEI